MFATFHTPKNCTSVEMKCVPTTTTTTTTTTTVSMPGSVGCAADNKAFFNFYKKAMFDDLKGGRDEYSVVWKGTKARQHILTCHREHFPQIWCLLRPLFALLYSLYLGPALLHPVCQVVAQQGSLLLPGRALLLDLSRFGQ